jgi:microcystin-dependent protein
MAADFVGAVKLISWNFASRGYAFCNGQLLPINQNQALFSLLGTTFGGNGQTNFALPNLQGSVPVGMGSGAGLTPRVIGQTGGSPSVTLLASNTPPHIHALNATTATTTGTVPGTGVLTGSLSASDGPFYTAPGQAGFTVVAMNDAAVNSKGGREPHNNIQPSMVINYMIALQGVFPSRN